MSLQFSSRQQNSRTQLQMLVRFWYLQNSCVTMVTDTNLTREYFKLRSPEPIFSLSNCVRRWTGTSCTILWWMGRQTPFIHTLIQKLKSVARVTQSCFWRQEVGCGLKSWTVAPKFSKMAIDHSTLLVFWLMFHVNNCFDVSKLYMYDPHGLKMNTSF